MPSAQIDRQISSNELLKAASQLSPSELEKLVANIIALQAQRRAPSLPKAEADLLLKINQGIPADLQKRYNELIAKRRAATLSPDEYEELLRMTDDVEKLQARRVEYLAELASIRKVSLAKLMDDLGISGPGYE
ncbi:STAS/SEC14 domain-containing protein [candidate division KSB1 bacterium]|nr:STAS/SEC14 domain-containing protein [candidate division KSB1 bacterium]